MAVYIVCFLAGGLYSVLWKYAGERDLIRLAGMIAVPTAVVYVEMCIRDRYRLCWMRSTVLDTGSTLTKAGSRRMPAASLSLIHI